MRANKLAGILLFATALALCWGESQPLGKVSSFQRTTDGIEVSSGAAKIRVSVLAPAVFRLHYALDGAFLDHASWAVVPNAFPANAAFDVKETEAAISIVTSKLQLDVMKNSSRVVFRDTAGEVIAEDAPNRPIALTGKSFRVWKSMPIDEHYFGLGDKAGPLDHRDSAFTMWNTDAYGWRGGSDPLYKSIPFFLALHAGKSYGIHLDDTYRSSFDFGKEFRDAYSFGAEDGELDYYFFYGPEPKQVVEEYTALTGRTPLPPKFALGYQQSRYSYSPQSQVLEIASELRRRKIPADAIYLDIDYQQDNRPFTINRERFPDFEGMVRQLDANGFKLVVITDLHIPKLPGYKPYDEGEARNLFVKNPDGSDYVGRVWPGDCVFPDFTRAEVRQWWGTLYTGFSKMGVRGFWNDMNEPAVFRYPEKTMPLDVVHNMEGRKTDHREAHNVYGMENVRGTYEGALTLAPDQRPFVLTRAGFAGTQRYAATWTGDNMSSWEHLRLTVPTLLSLGIAGYAFAGTDVGGFQGNPSADLLTRWTELGAFLPMFRNHSDKGTRMREPWVDGPEHEAVRRQYIELRYQLMPYLYTSVEQTTRTGVPLMRPMFMEFPDDPALATNEREFMFGDSLMIAAPLDTIGKYEVQFPKGVWFDYRTGKKIESEKLTVDPPLDVLPVYIRGGAILPQQPVVQNTREIPKGPLELRVYAGPNCQGSLYDDAGDGFAYTRGEYLRVNYTCDISDSAFQLTRSGSEGSYPAWWKSVQITVFGTKQPVEVEMNGNPVTGWKYDAASATVTVTCHGSDLRDLSFRY